MHAYAKKLTLILASLALLVSAGLAGCTRATPAQSGPVTLRLAVLPIIDTLPMYVAQQEGLFEKHGVAVTFIPVQSAQERDQIIAAGQADGMINEPLSAMFFNRESVQVQIVRYARAATPQVRLFSILAAGSSGITTPQDLSGVEIGVSKGTVIEYLTDRLLEAEGLSSADIMTIAVPGISDRLSLLASGQLKAATLPEPLTTLAQQQGAVVVLDDTRHPEYSYSTYTFRKAVIDQNPAALRGFLAAIEEAVTLINTEGTRFAGLLTEQKLVPAPLQGSFEVPTFGAAGVPTLEQWNDALAWAQAEGLLTQDLRYEDTVTPAYLP